MADTSFNALEAARRLEGAGFERGQAETIAGITRDAVLLGRGELATKADLANLKADLANLKVWLVLTVVGSNAAFAGILFAALSG